MLDIIRRKQKSPIIRIIFWAIIFAFIGGAYLLYVDSDGRQSGTNRAALIINGTPVSMEAYQNTYQNLLSVYQQIYGQSFTPELERQLNLRRQAVLRLIEQQLLLAEAEKMELEISNDELIAAIYAEPAFQMNGVYNKEIAERVIRKGYRMTPDQYKEIKKRELLILKVSEILTADVDVTDENVLTAFKNENDKVSLNFVQLLPQLFEGDVQLDEAELTAFFDANKEDFRLPEQVALRYIQFAPSRYEEKIQTPTLEDMETYYQRNLSQFEIQEQVRASHILVRVSESATEEQRQEKRALIDGYLTELNNGKDFAELARAVSDDTNNAPVGGDLGYIRRGTLPGDFEQTAFSLEPGQISSVVASPVGLHLIKVTERIEAGYKPLADETVAALVKEAIIREKGQALALEMATDAFKINQKTGDLAAAAEANNLGIKETGFFGPNDPIDGIGQSPELAAAAFNLSEGQLARPIETSAGIYLVTLKEKKPSRLPELGEVRPLAEQAYRSEKAVSLAKEKAEALLQKVQAGGSLSEAAAADKLTVENTGLFSASFGEFVPRLGTAPELADVAHQLTPEAPSADKVFFINGKQVVVELKERQDADMTQLTDAAKETMKQRLLREKQTTKLQETVTLLQEAADLKIDPTLEDFINNEG